MTNDELLLEISNMMDVKLKGELQPIKRDMQDMKNDIQDMKCRITVIESDLEDVKSDLENMRGDLENVKNEIHMVKLCQENVILPRLNTIESCYTDTYHRYRDDADKMESVSSDVELLKRVVSEHSERLQKLA